MMTFEKSNLELVKALEPAAVLRQFALLSCVPRGSGHTAQISDYCVRFARAHALDCRQDAAGNVVIYKNGSAGREQEPPVILQGHMDMVIDKAPGCGLTMEQDGVELKTDGEFLFANGTTLGGDDGIALAMCFAILEEQNLSHPPLEVVFTVDEETGMEGAFALDPALLKGRRLLNLDSEAEGTLWVSCAGGARVDLRLPMHCVPVTGSGYRLTVSGLHGGHSGAEIHLGYANANVLLAAALPEIGKVRIASVSGGSADNAIPHQSSALFLTDAVLDPPATAARLQSELRGRSPQDPDLTVTLVPETVHAACSAKESAQLLGFLRALPNGVIAMSREIPDLVETSLNLGVMKSDVNGVSCIFSVRSSVDAAREALQARLETVAQAYGAAFAVRSPYPAWEYQPVSPLRETMCAVYRAMYGSEMTVTAIHAGLECGLFCGKLPGLDCVSFGPDIFDIHTARERLSLPSTARVWQYLCAVLAAL